jgi:hypothetical protein
MEAPRKSSGNPCQPMFFLGFSQPEKNLGFTWDFPDVFLQIFL